MASDAETVPDTDAITGARYAIHCLYLEIDHDIVDDLLQRLDLALAAAKAEGRREALRDAERLVRARRAGAGMNRG